MTWNLTALALVFVTSAALAESSAGVFSDKRIAIGVTQSEKNQVLYEMREYLHYMHSLNLALARQDMKGFAITAKSVGLTNRLPGSLKGNLPEEFSQMSAGMDESFQKLSNGAEKNVDMRQMHENLAEALAYCSGCHDAFRFNVTLAKH